MRGEFGPILREAGLRFELPDGVVLVADSWRPAEGGPWPVLLQRLPYGRSVASTPVLPHPSWFAAHGYLVVVQDVRGRGDSGGAFDPFIHASADGAASVEWAASLPHSNGDVGMYGFSYQGLLQLYAAAEKPPSLSAIAPMMCAPDPYEGWTYEGGALRWPFVCFWAAQLAGQELGEGQIAYDVDAMPASSALGDEPPTWFVEWLQHNDGNDAYWKERRPNIGAIDVPSFVVAGWFDDFSSATLKLADQLRAHLHIGPWTHIPWGTRAGHVELGVEASPSTIGPALVDFFDRHLKADDRAVGPNVRYYTHGLGWETALAWPPIDEQSILSGHSDGNANSRHGDGVLQDEAPEQPLTDVIVVEPHFPFPGDDTPLSDEGPAEDRRDVCCYTTQTAEAPRILTGTPVVVVEAICDRPSYDVVASLVLLDRDQPPRRLCTGIRRVEATPRDEQTVAIELRPISWRLPAGSQLRLDISGARFPAFDRNPHTGAIPTTDVPSSETAVATLEILSVNLTLPLAKESQI